MTQQALIPVDGIMFNDPGKNGMVKLGAGGWVITPPIIRCDSAAQTLTTEGFTFQVIKKEKGSD